MKIDSEEEAIFIAERKEWGVRSVSKLNRPIPLSAVFGRANLAPTN